MPGRLTRKNEQTLVRLVEELDAMRARINEFVPQLHELLAKAIPEYGRPKRPKLMAISGGRDASVK